MLVEDEDGGVKGGKRKGRGEMEEEEGREGEAERGNVSEVRAAAVLWKGDIR